MERKYSVGFTEKLITEFCTERCVCRWQTYNKICVISGFRLDIDEICALLGYYAALNDNPLPMFRDNVSVQFSWNSLPLKMGPTRCPETSVKVYHSTLRNTQ
jgi:hypothetical protein